MGSLLVRVCLCSGSSQWDAAMAAAASPAAAAAAASAAPRQRNNSGAAAAGAGEDDAPIDVDADVSDSDWTLPELKLLMDQPHFKHRLTPATAPVFNKYNQAELDALVGEVMRFILARSSAGQITTHKSILELLGERARNGANPIIMDARRRFMSIWGWELKELNKLDAPASTKAGGRGKPAPVPIAGVSDAAKSGQYILRVPTQLPANLARAYNFGAADWAEDSDDEGELMHDDQAGLGQAGEASTTELHKGLLEYILGMLYADEKAQAQAGGAGAGGAGGAGASVAQFQGTTATMLWKSLQRIDPEMHPRSRASHPIFGNVPELLDEFVKQGYLDRSKYVPPPDAPPATREEKEEQCYRIGSRTFGEINHTGIYTAICEAMMGQKPDPTHLRQIERDELLKKNMQTGAKMPPKPAAPAQSQ